MTSYERPPLPRRTFRDSAGAVIPYGARWEPGDAPVEAYSVVEHPERFEPIGMIGRALIEHLISAYDVSHVREAVTDRSDDFAFDEVVRFAPPADCAPLTIWVGALHVVVEAGAFYQLDCPDCGCDACDDDVEAFVGLLETVVLAVAAGELREWVSQDNGMWAMHRFPLGDGEFDEGGTGATTSDEVAALKEQAVSVPDRWRSWPTR